MTARSPRYPPAPPRTPEIVRQLIPRGLAGTQRTVAHIMALIRAGAGDFYVRQHAIDVLLDKRVQPKDYLGEIRALFEWVQKNVRYTKDPFRIEVLHSARRMLELRAGDCDDITVVLGAMLEAIGHPVRLVLTGPDPAQPALLTHIYLEAFLRGDWISLDATMSHPPGWAPHTPVRRVVPLERSAIMAAQTAGAVSDSGAPPGEWLAELIRDIEGGGLRPGDARVRSLSQRLAGNPVLRGSRWLRAALRYLWDRGLSARPHPRTAQRLAALLRRGRLLPSESSQPAGIGAAALPTVPVAPRMLRPVAARSLGKARPANLRRLIPLMPRGKLAEQPAQCSTCG